MLSAFGRAFRTPDLRRKLLFTLGIITIFRLGAFIPSPGVSYQNVQQCLLNGQATMVAGVKFWSRWIVHQHDWTMRTPR